ncbi:MBOAT family O-acyltransferase [Runella sp.]|uniref:MBOAT family O-acyltransferase n=1 Tax=Runella sp. TaxID=1960881 RepID=UPI003D1442A4
MLFNSFPFIFFLLLTFLFYYIPYFKRQQIYILIIASAIFYAYQNISLLILLCISLIINAATSYSVSYGNPLRQKTYVTIGVAVNIGILIFFKYVPLVARTFLKKDQPIADFLVTIPLPIGISFYTFHGISLLIDVFRNKAGEKKSIVPVSFITHLKNTCFYIIFFPQLIAGPIVKAHDFIPQIKEKSYSQIDWEFCFRHLVIGYFLKMVVADNLKEFTFQITYPYFLTYKSFDLLALLFGYSCQIFADFAGYSTIAIGLAGLFGYRLNINFNFPYSATSFKNFWQRWHISLSTFLMEYLYFPLGGNKYGKIRTYFNLFVVMTIGGLWHGASWSYLVWGFAHGVFLSIERFIFDYFKIKITTSCSTFYSLLVFLIVTLAWLLFRLEFNHALIYLELLFLKPSLSFNQEMFLYITIYSFPIVLYHWYASFKSSLKYLQWRNYEYIAFAILLFLIFFNSGFPGSFIYFQF